MYRIARSLRKYSTKICRQGVHSFSEFPSIAVCVGSIFLVVMPRKGRAEDLLTFRNSWSKSDAILTDTIFLCALWIHEIIHHEAEFKLRIKYSRLQLWRQGRTCEDLVIHGIVTGKHV